MRAACGLLTWEERLGVRCPSYYLIAGGCGPLMEAACAAFDAYTLHLTDVAAVAMERNGARPVGACQWWCGHGLHGLAGSRYRTTERVT
mmetsp:Transcript_90009/g.240461  ORF Transcript_90009/g.240461 Transcript_90009/m.240461 type:complete len:89 (+) Transcript_90009:555-821(+)